MSRQEEQVHKQLIEGYKAFLTSFDVKLTTKKGSKKVMAEFTLKGITSLDLSAI